MSGDAPHIRFNDQVDYKKLFFSNPEACLEIPITLKKGFGNLSVGTVIAVNTSASSTDKGKYIPYDPHATITGAEVAPTRAYLVSNHTSGGSSVIVTMEDSYKFIVGDDLLLQGSGEALENVGAITAIDRTTYGHIATITFTTASGKNYTTANFAYASVEGCETAVGVLKASRSTGSGEEADGALANLVLKNALLYTGMLVNMDTNAKTDLSAATISQFVRL